MSVRAGVALAVAVAAVGALTLAARGPADTTPPVASPAPLASSAPAPSPAPSPALAGAVAARPTSFEHGQPSLDDVGRAFVAGLAAHDREALLRLSPSYGEYARLLYPEFVKAGEPLLGSMGLQWAWDNLGHASLKDLKRLLDELGGKRLTFVSIATAPNQPRGSIALYPKVVVRARDESGAVVELRGVFAIVAKDGAYKVLRYRDNRDDRD